MRVVYVRTPYLQEVKVYLRTPLCFCSMTLKHGLNFANLYLKILAPVGRYRSSQTGQTVNLLAYAFGGASPSRPTT